jgi:hypothetical protein
MYIYVLIMQQMNFYLLFIVSWFINSLDSELSFY